VDLADKLEETALAAVGSALLSLDTEPRRHPRARESTAAPILDKLGFESLYTSYIYRWEP
jgi:hypothetical protein